jgi:hypothetical protein
LSAASLTHLTEFILLMNAFVNPVMDDRMMVPVPDKSKALVLFAHKGDSGEYRKVLAAIRAWKERDDARLAKSRQAEKAIEAGIRDQKDLLKGAGAQAARLVKLIESKEQDLKLLKAVRPAFQKLIDNRVKEEQAFTKVYKLIEKERQRGDKQPTLLIQVLLQLADALGPFDDKFSPSPVSLQPKVKALLLIAQKGDSSEHKKELAAIRQRQKKTEDLIAKHRGFLKEVQDSLRDDKALLAKTQGDTSGIEKRIAGHKRSLAVLTGDVACLRKSLQDRVKEEKAWVEVLRLIDNARKTKKP